MLNSAARHLRLLAWALLCVPAVLWPTTAQAAQVTFEISTDSGPRRATVETATRDGVSYVPLGYLVRQAGGQTQVTASRVTADFGRQAALIELGQSVVSGSQAQFQLAHPVLAGGGEAWVAVEDVAPLFRQAFGAVARTVATPAAPDEDALLEAPESSEAPGTAPRENARPVVVVLDPGHGGDDAGARGQTLEEKAFTLALAQRLAEALGQDSRVKAVLTRTNDSTLPALDRANLAIRQRGRLLVSLHAGAESDKALRGIEIFYPSDADLGDVQPAGGRSSISVSQRYRYVQEGRTLAEAVAAALEGLEGATLRPIRPVRSPLLSRVPMPGIVIEAGYLTHPADEQALSDAAWQQALAGAIADGIRRYLGLDAPPAEPAVASSEEPYAASAAEETVTP